MRKRVMMMRVVANGSTSCPCRILFLSPREMTLLLPRIPLLEDKCWLSIQELLHFIRQLLSITTTREASLDGADMEVVSSLLQACNALALRWIELLDCYKMLVNIANHVENPSLTELQQLKILSLGACSGLGVLRKKVEVGHLNDYFGRIIFPVDTILEWFNHCKEASNNTESCEIDIDGSDL
ncbi:uncharacterized protein LOC122295757 isoform X2 [Carya illinoinensis]|uniref:uncharacterized protein LOC122295757 isoform X2 n=1 Tax=Carya illinoinensis TaxID=32201 RepID=UPI001C721A44|nr:uncharacterized protein LOC122295757 isoform X2 [Carya illinoinensis]XP_042960911.1 uncharacterized protein LOC122295757 isoform X2 [Carya illinoinensis]XP_042960912.1 uncharacterized protein LOC122295757 isoform X2 [Carya illinoinensis]